MESVLKYTGRKVLEIYEGRIYYPDQIDFDEAVKDKRMLGYPAYFTLNKISLIEDEKNKVQFFIGDCSGDDETFGFTIKLFIYNDGKALGTIKYLAESNWLDDKIEAKYIKLKNNAYFIYGSWLSQEKQNTTLYRLLFTINKPEIKKKNPINANTTLLNKISTTSKTRQQNSLVLNSSKNGSKNISKDKSVSQNKDDITIVSDFEELDPIEEKKANLYFLSYLLLKMGYHVLLGDNNLQYPDLILRKDNKYVNINVLSSTNKIGSWKFDIPKGCQDDYYVFCHTISKEFFPDIYVVKGKELITWLRKFDKISTSNHEMQRIKNSWGTLI